MTDALIPEWVKKRKESMQAGEAKAQSAHRDALLAERIIQTEGPCFWKQLLKELQITIDSLPEINIRASLIDMVGAPVETRRVYLMREGNFPRQTYSDLSYAGPGSPDIRYYPQAGNPLVLRFGIFAKEQLKVYGDHGPMNPEEVAAHVVEAMVEQID